MRSRIHFDLLSGNSNLFKVIGQATPHVAAQKFNPYTAPHASICGTIGHETEDTAFEATFDQRYERMDSAGLGITGWKFPFRVPHTVVMRGHVQCSCCGPTCFHCGQGVVAKRDPQDGHGPGAEYNEGVLDLSVLQPLAREACAKVGDKAYGQQLADLAQSVGISAADIKAHVPYIKGNVEDVFAATTAKSCDIFYTAAFLHLFTHPDRGWLKNAHNKLSRDWPQRPGVKPIDVEVMQ